MAIVAAQDRTPPERLSISLPLTTMEKLRKYAQFLNGSDLAHTVNELLLFAMDQDSDFNPAAVEVNGKKPRRKHS